MTEVDSSGWSGEGTFTQVLVDHLQSVAEVRLVRVEDAPASRSEADYNFISNEIFVDFSDADGDHAGARGSASFRRAAPSRGKR